YQAVTSRDRRFDGMFFAAVRTTGIFCRPSCPARTPRPENVEFFSTAAAAAEAGFRACRRCRPDASPNSPDWDTRGDVVARTERVRTARTLIEATTMPVSDIAFAAGFASIRQFNDTFRDMYSLSPRQLRTAGSGAEVTDELVLRLAYRRPLDLEYLLDYLRVRA